MKKSISTIALTLGLALSLTVTAFAATKAVTKTITFNSYSAEAKDFAGQKATLSISNVTAQVTKDYSIKLSDGKKKITFAGKKSNVLTCKAPVTVTLLPNKGEKHAGLYDFYTVADVSTYKSVKRTDKYYAFNVNKYAFDFSKKLSVKPAGDCGYADGSTQTFTKAGTYVIYTRHMNAVDDTDATLTPVFVIVK